MVYVRSCPIGLYLEEAWHWSSCLEDGVRLGLQWLPDTDFHAGQRVLQRQLDFTAAPRIAVK
jgi:hypothetical protein